MSKPVSSKPAVTLSPRSVVDSVTTKSVEAGKYLWRTHKAVYDLYKADIRDTWREANATSATPEEDRARRDRVAANVGRIAVNLVFDVFVPLSPLVRDSLADAPTSAPPRSPPRRRAPKPTRGS
jgi:hypothetical protein